MAKRLPKKNYQDLQHLYKGKKKKDLQRFDRRSVSPFKRITLFFFVLLAFATLLAWLGFYLFSSIGSDIVGEVSLTVSAPERVAVGGAVTYQIQLHNSGAIPAETIAVRVNYPDGFVFRSASLTPETPAQNTWAISKLAPGERKEIEVVGSLLGEEGNLRTIFAIATYQLKNFRTALEVSDSTASLLAGGSLRIEVTGPAQLSPGERAIYTVWYQNDGDDIVPPSQLRLFASSGLTITEMDPVPTNEQNYEWDLPELGPEEEGEIVIDTTIASSATSTQSLRAVIEGKNDSGATFTLAEDEQQSSLVTGDLQLRLLANDSEIIAPVPSQERISFTLRYKYTGEEPITDAKAVVALTAPGLIDWPNVTASSGGDSADPEISWVATTTPLLAKIVPGGEGELAVTVPLLPARAANLTLRATATMSYVTDSLTARKTASVSELIVPITTGADLQVDARYFDDAGNAIGSGSLPPQVDKPTTYQVTWRIGETIHPLRNVVITGIPPEQVAVKAVKASVGTITIKESKPVWQIVTLIAGLGAQATFTYTLTPEQNDEGKIVVLTGQTALAANDTITGGVVEVTGEVLTTGSISDELARGKGVVQP